IVVEEVEKPREENRGIVHIKENLAVIAGRELPVPEVSVCGILRERRKMFFQPGAADADDWPEPVRPDQPLERYSSQLSPGPQPEAPGVGRNVPVDPGIHDCKADAVFLATRDLEAGRVAQLLRIEDIRGTH